MKENYSLKQKEVERKRKIHPVKNLSSLAEDV